MKKAFTLLELIISITLFMIIVIFLYKTLDETKYSNNLFSNKQSILKQSNDLHNIFLEDIAQASTINISYDKNKNAIVKIVSLNTFHSAFFTNITYFIEPSKELMRIESKEELKETERVSYDFLNNCYIDILSSNVEYFDVKNVDINYELIIKQFNKNRTLYNTYKIR